MLHSSPTGSALCDSWSPSFLCALCSRGRRPHAHERYFKAGGVPFTAKHAKPLVITPQGQPARPTVLYTGESQVEKPRVRFPGTIYWEPVDGRKKGLYVFSPATLSVGETRAVKRQLGQPVDIRGQLWTWAELGRAEASGG